MKRTVGVCVVLAALGGCVTLDEAPDQGGGCFGGRCYSGTAPSVPGMQGPWGQPVPVAAPYMGTPASEMAARAMMAQSVPLELMQSAGAMPPGMMGGIAQANCPPGGCPPGSIAGPPGAVAAVGALTGGIPPKFPTKRTEVRFIYPRSMKIAWYAPSAAGKSGFTSTQLEVPGRYNFVQAAIYRLRLSDIPGRPGVYLYPTLEVVPSNAKTDPFLAHTAVPISFTDEDINQVLQGNYIIKVIYLPDPQYQDLAATGTGEIVSSLLEPGVDPIAEAHRRGSILCIVRMGNIDLEAPETPAMDAPSPYQPKLPMPPPMPQGMAPGMMPPGQGMNAGMMPGGGRPMVPYGMVGPNGQMMPPGAGGMGPNGQMMMPPGAPMMGPNGQMMMPPGGPMMGPNGQMMMPPGGPMMPPGMPGMQPGAQLPPAPDQPAVVQMLPPANVGAQQNTRAVQYAVPTSDTATPAGAASQDQAAAPAKSSSKPRTWWRSN